MIIIKVTVFSVVMIAVLLVMMGQAQSLGAPQIFTAVVIFMIVLAGISLVKGWLFL